MSRFADRFREEGLQQGRREGLQQGEAAVVLRQLRRKFGELPDGVRERIETADPGSLLTWSDRILTAKSLDEVLH
jgi:hypothetical protein